MVEKVKKTARIELKMTPQMKEKVKLKYGHNISKTIHKHFEKELQKDDLNLKRFETCYNCKNQNNYKLSDEKFYMTNFISTENDMHNNQHIIFCEDCRNKILNESDEEIKEKYNSQEADERLIIKCLLENAHIYDEDLFFIQAELLKYFPEHWKMNGACIWSEGIKDAEEIKEQFYKIHDIKANRG